MKADLSDRELQVLEYAVKGYTDDMIAQAMNIEKGTVNSYWVRIPGKLDHLSRTHLGANYLRLQAEEQPDGAQRAPISASSLKWMALATALALAAVAILRAPF